MKPVTVLYCCAQPIPQRPIMSQENPGYAYFRIVSCLLHFSSFIHMWRYFHLQHFQIIFFLFVICKNKGLCTYFRSIFNEIKENVADSRESWAYRSLASLDIWLYSDTCKHIQLFQTTRKSGHQKTWKSTKQRRQWKEAKKRKIIHSFLTWG